MSSTEKLQHFPISFFAMVMGFGGLGLAWNKATEMYALNASISTVILTLTCVVFALLIALFIAKLIRHPQAVLAEWQSPIKLNFFPAISISLLLIAMLLLPLSHDISRVFWIAGSVLHLGFSVHVINAWLHHERFKIQHLNPAWFIPAVGNVLVPVAGVPLGYHEISWLFFSVGMMFWLMLLTIVFYRMLFHEPLPERLTPTLFILIAPPAVGFIAYLRLHGEVDAFARVLYYFSLFLTLLMVSQTARFMRLPFYLSWWAYSFPIAAFSIASLIMAEQTGALALQGVGIASLGLLSLLVLLLFVKTLLAIQRGQICQPES